MLRKDFFPRPKNRVERSQPRDLRRRRGEDVEALRSADTPVEQAHSRAGRMRATVSPAGVRLPKHAPVVETVRSYDPFWGL